MLEEVLINSTPQETRVAVVRQGVVQELHIERNASRGLVGNIYLGKVVRILPGMQSAFIDIGLERTAFLHVADIWEAHAPDAPVRAIERILFEGKSVVVQVIKEPIGTKGARLSTQVSMAGRMLVYLPQETHIGISQRIENEADRDALREKIKRLISKNASEGYIVRTMAEDASEDELAADIEYLRKLWGDIRNLSKTQSPPALLYQELSLAQRVIRDFVKTETSRIVIDSEENFRQLTAFAEEYMPGLLPLIEHYPDEMPLFDLHGVEQEIQKALARRVELKSGGYLIVDQTEAMTTIDVNTGAFVGIRNFDETVFKTNLEAAQAIARQLRLRNLGGIIIVDFIDMDSEEHRAAVLAELNKALEGDHTRLTVNGFTSLGLVEMTRKRTRESLSHVLCEECPTCGGRGEVKTARTVCHEIMRDLLRESRQFNAREFRVLASVPVIDIFLDEESQGLAMLSDQIGKTVSLKPEASYSREQYDIVLI
ncbi:MAG: ribonuclease G [Candidatus Accumulibacter sp.]|jgi:ribonuclease G|nr:ribonuclease G [Accumulibacter sp.]